MTIVREDWVAAVVLAAGGSTRFGSAKQLVESKGETLVHRAARAAFDAGVDPVIVVLGAEAKSVAAALEDLPNVRCVVNTDWESGLASSFSAGLRAVLDKTECDGALVTLADQPFVDSTALASLLEKFEEGHRLVASSYDGVIGVPALFGREFLEELTHLTGDAGAGSWLRARSGSVAAVPLERAALDIDTPSHTSLLQ